MGKFFKKKAEICSICGLEKMIYKDVRQGIGVHFKYCRECYDEYYKRIEDRVKAQVQIQVKSGQMIGMKEALAITREITAEVEAEQLAELQVDATKEDDEEKKPIKPEEDTSCLN